MKKRRNCSSATRLCEGASKNFGSVPVLLSKFITLLSTSMRTSKTSRAIPNMLAECRWHSKLVKQSLPDRARVHIAWSSQLCSCLFGLPYVNVSMRMGRKQLRSQDPLHHFARWAFSDLFHHAKHGWHLVAGKIFPQIRSQLFNGQTLCYLKHVRLFINTISKSTYSRLQNNRSCYSLTKLLVFDAHDHHFCYIFKAKYLPFDVQSRNFVSS